VSDDDDCNDSDDCPDYTVTRLVSLYRKIIGLIINVHDLHRLIIGHVIHTDTCLDRLHRHEFFMAQEPPVRQDFLIHEVFLITLSDAPQLVELLWTSDQASRRDLYLTSHNTYNRQTFMPRRDSNPQSQQAKSR
jgi:hypothetical protein